MTAPTVADPRNWELWIVHSSTEDRLSQVIHRAHRELYAHNTCPFSDCDVHATPLIELPVLAHDIDK